MEIFAVIFNRAKLKVFENKQIKPPEKPKPKSKHRTVKNLKPKKPHDVFILKLSRADCLVWDTSVCFKGVLPFVTLFPRVTVALVTAHPKKR